MTIITILSLNATAEDKNSIDISHIRLKKNGDLVSLSFDVTVGHNSTKEYKLITPTIKKESESKDFASIGIESRRAKIISLRNKDRNKNVNMYSFNRGQTFIYADTILYEDWMSGGKLVLNFVDSACCKIITLYTELKMSNIEFSKDVKAEIHHPKIVAKICNTVDNGKAVYFAQGKADLDYRSSDNYKFLNQISDTISNIVSNTKNQLANIEITGFASPEGVYQSNMQLSCKRANAVKNHLMKNIPELSDSLFTLNCLGENWDDLLRMVQLSNMQYKDEVLEIFENTTMDDRGIARKNALKQLKNGIPYKYMLDNFYPELRNAKNVAITYTSIEDEKMIFYDDELIEK